MGILQERINSNKKNMSGNKPDNIQAADKAVQAAQGLVSRMRNPESQGKDETKPTVKQQAVQGTEKDKAVIKETVKKTKKTEDTVDLALNRLKAQNMLVKEGGEKTKTSTTQQQSVTENRSPIKDKNSNASILENKLKDNAKTEKKSENKPKQTSINTKPANYKVDTEPYITEDEYEDEMLAQELRQTRLENLREARAKRRNKVVTVLLIIGCVYLVFLIYGAINTQYVYNPNGEVAAERLSITELKDIKEFDKIANQYRQARSIYEEVLLLDYRIGAGIEDPLIVAPEYEKLLNGEINSLSRQLGGVEVIDSYNQLLSMIEAWVKTDIAVYCQNMSSAISQNNTVYMEQALEYRNIAYNDFSVITQNIATLGSQVSGVDITDIVSWSPENYIQTSTGGIYNGTGN